MGFLGGMLGDLGLSFRPRELGFFGCIVCLLAFHLLARVYANKEVDALVMLRNSLIDPNHVLQSWDQNLVDPCSWFHVSCTSGTVTRVDLGYSNLSGTLVPQLGVLENLQYLELYSNNISGKIPTELGNLVNLVSLDLYLNNLSGEIPDTLGNLANRLNSNSLSGPIPKSLTNISKLQVLDLSSNNLSGGVPYTGSFSIFTPISFANNPLLCGPGTTTPCPGAPFSPPPGGVSPSPPSPEENSASSTGAIAGGVAAAAALMFAAPTIWFIWWRSHQSHVYFFDVPAEEDPGVHLGQLKRFSLRELEVATDGFRKNHILGVGGFGTVYKGRLADGSLMAVKRLKEERTPRGELQFQAEVEMISMAVHHNLLRLIGFCMTPTERLLVYPYMANGSVESCLRERTPSQPALDWSTRRRIALGASRGLSYLHDHCDPKIIHRDVKAANILLDEEFEAIVGDFGLAKFMNHKDTHITTAVCGTLGHIPPEYLSTGKSSEKTDVFGYGIMLLELITGQRAKDLAKLADDDDAMPLDWEQCLTHPKVWDRVMNRWLGFRNLDPLEDEQNVFEANFLESGNASSGEGEGDDEFKDGEAILVIQQIAHHNLESLRITQEYNRMMQVIQQIALRSSEAIEYLTNIAQVFKDHKDKLEHIENLKRDDYQKDVRIDELTTEVGNLQEVAKKAYFENANLKARVKTLTDLDKKLRNG